MMFDLGRAINTYKAQTGLTNEDIASITSRSTTSVSQWVNDKQEPSISSLIVMCSYSGITLSKFIKWGE